jgi:Papain-like cysteine protease AvrRpt2/Secretion system C-terminal sorting domain
LDNIFVETIKNIFMKKIYFALVCSFAVIANLNASFIQNVPYFYQYNNSYNPHGSCQNTSIAMVTSYYGATTQTPDQCSNYYGTSQAQTVSGLQAVFNSEAQFFNLPISLTGYENGYFTDIHALLNAGKPVIVHGWFTGYGHVMVIVGFTGTHYICNDPAGRWGQQYGVGGYSQSNATEGNNVSYSKAAFESAIGPSGTIWYYEVNYLNGYTGPGSTVVTPPVVSDAIAPTSIITASSTWKTTDFAVNFTDADAGGSNLEKSFYSAVENNQGKWQGNGARGFAFDDFSGNLATTWVASAGTWAANAGKLNQTSTTATNASLSFLINQTLSNRSLYHWKAKITSTGATQRVGFHYFCDDVAQSNRGNSYFVWFRQATNSVEIFKVVNNVFSSPVATFSNVTIANNVQYDFKLMFDRITGKTTIWLNNTLIGNYTDAVPHNLGNGISFRTAESAWEIDEINVYRSRPVISALVRVGAANTNEVRFENLNSTTASSQVFSLTVDGAQNLSTINSQQFNVDFSKPSSVTIQDGSSADIATTLSTTSLSANWTTSSDVNSGVGQYTYFVGTTPGASDVIDSTTTSTTNFTQTNLSLVVGNTYYVTVFATNGAGLKALSATSNGVLVTLNTADIGDNNYSIDNIYPNPMQNELFIKSNEAIENIQLIDVNGKSIYVEIFAINEGIKINTNNLSEGLYVLNYTKGNERFSKKVIKK